MWTARAWALIALISLTGTASSPAAASEGPEVALARKLDLYQREAKLISRRPQFRGLTRFEPKSARLSETSLRAGGRVLLVHIWATTCSVCKAEMPMLARLLAHVTQSRSARIVMLAEDLPSDFLRFFAEHAAELPEGEYLVGKTDGDLRADLQESAQPLTLLLDGDLTIRHAFIGPLEDRRNDLLSAIQRLARCAGSAHRSAL